MFVPMHIVDFSWMSEFDPLVLVNVNLEDPPNSCK